jgi:hypothetical protein
MEFSNASHCSLNIYLFIYLFLLIFVNHFTIKYVTVCGIIMLSALWMISVLEKCYTPSFTSGSEIMQSKIISVN